MAAPWCITREMDLIDEANASWVEELEEKVTQARHDYYNGTPSASDEEFDAWVDELAELKADSPAVTAVGASPVSAWPKVGHSIPMGSLDKVQTLDEMTSWVQKTSRPKAEVRQGYEQLLVTEKLDGISVSLKYVEGKFVQALTRGDGATGEDITPNVARMKGVVKELPKPLNVMCRGEIVLLKQDHRDHFPETANPRNTASGTSKRLDGTGSEHLTVMCYAVPEVEGVELPLETDVFTFLEEMGFKVPKWFMSALAVGVKTPHDLWVDYTTYLREELPYEIDGLVVRLNDRAYQLSLGERNGRPLGAVAFKFAPITRETVAIERVDQVGGTGRITPVAVFKPIRILGAEISRASLYNQKYIEQIGWGVGAKILVSRANDVIPRVVSVTGVAPDGVSQPPTHCPECGTETERDGEYVVCPNTGGCPAQTEGRIKTWIQKQGILEWGPMIIQRVVEAGLVKKVPDLYRLTVDDLSGLERMGESSAQNAVNELWKINPMPLEMFTGSLGIPLCGRSTMQAVVEAGFDTLDKIQEATGEQLQNIPGMGPKRAAALRGWLDKHADLFEEMIEVGLKIKAKIVGSLSGKSVCFTGKSRNKRASLEKMVTEAGGKVKKSVGKGLTYLVLADPNSTTTKAKAARKNGTECISEDSFLEMVGADGE